jgi:hypothetical protein
MSEEPLPKHRVALTVFATVEGVDPRDAADSFERMLRDRLPRDGRLEFTMPTIGDETITKQGKVILMMDTGTALRNGYLTAGPSSAAWRTFGHEDPDAPPPTPLSVECSRCGAPAEHSCADDDGEPMDAFHVERLGGSARTVTMPDPREQVAEIVADPEVYVAETRRRMRER